jgi:hypothetical protein
VELTLTYSIKTLTKTVKSKIQATDMTFFLSIVGKTRKDRIRNELFKQAGIRRHKRSDYNGYDTYKEWIEQRHQKGIRNYI